MANFNSRTLTEYADSLANYMPGGRLFAAKAIEGTNFRKLLIGAAGELYRANSLIMEFDKEIIPDQTTKLISEWESALGIPDSCFSGEGTDEERRRDILVKLASLGVQTEQDFINLASIFGISVNIVAGGEVGRFPYTLPMIFFSSTKEALFTMIVEFTDPAATGFPYTFPLLFGTEVLGILECLFRKIAPANVQLIFRQG